MNWAKGQPLQNGKYVIEKTLGSGSFGITYKARHTFLDYDVVIKTPNEDVKSEPDYAKYVERFIKEGRMLAQLSYDPHPHIVRISDLFQEGDTHCLVMDYIPGESLWHLVGRRGALSETEAVEYIRQIGSALSVVHQKKLVHLDVNPLNIMVRNNGKAMLIDFGIAADIMSQPSTLSRSFGTPAFAPYELRQGKRYPSVDIYCLAASLYYAVTGQCPTKSFERKYDGIELKAPKRLVPGISDALNQAILKGMALEAKVRPQSVQAWLQLLDISKNESKTLSLPKQKFSFWRGLLPQTDDLSSERGVEYTKQRVLAQGNWRDADEEIWRVVQVQPPTRYRALLNYLGNGRWREADIETGNVMLEIARRKSRGYLDIEDIKKFPCEDLRIIDQLWVKFSGGRFGFSVQKQIYVGMGNKPDGQLYVDELERFLEKVGWWEDVIFNINAPQGLLPLWGCWLRLESGFLYTLLALFSRLETCKI